MTPDASESKASLSINITRGGAFSNDGDLSKVVPQPRGTTTGESRQVH